MPPDTPVTNADRELIQALAARGLAVTPTKLKRWRAAHLLPSPVQREAGRGRGRPSESYPDGTVDRAFAVARILSWPPPRVTLIEVPVWLFLLGHEIEMHLVRDGFVSSYQEFLRKLPSPTDEPAIDMFAERAVDRFSRHPLGKAVVARLGVGAVRRVSAAGAAAYSIVYHLFGEIATPLGMRTITMALGVDDEDLQAEAIGHVEEMRLHRIVPLLSDLSDDELLAARDNCLRAIEWLGMVLPADVTDSAKNQPHELRRRFRFDADVAMIAIIQMARMKRIYPNLTERFIHLLHEARNHSPNSSGPVTVDGAPLPPSGFE